MRYETIVSLNAYGEIQVRRKKALNPKLGRAEKRWTTVKPDGPMDSGLGSLIAGCVSDEERSDNLAKKC
jgi:hypothetical protein